MEARVKAVCAAMVFAAMAAGAKVHDMAEAFAAANGANPYAEEGGGTWTWGRTASTSVWTARTPAADVFMAMEDGRLRLAPPATGFAGAQFTVPEEKVYTVKVEAETLADADGKVGLYVLVNKTFVFLRTLDRSERTAEGGAKAELEWCSITPLKPGDEIHVVADAGADKTDENDEIALKVRIESEEGGKQWANFDFADVFRQMVEDGTNWVKCAKGETLGLYAAGATSSFWTDSGDPQFRDPNPGYNRPALWVENVFLPGFDLFAENAYHFFVLNDTEDVLATADVNTGYNVTPGDFFVHPGTGNPTSERHSNWAVRFRPSAIRAKYDVCVSARDACVHSAGDNGVDIAILTNGVEAVRKHVNGAVGRTADTVFASGLEVWADGAIDVLLDAKGQNTADGTVLNVKIRSSETEPTGANVNAAMIANMRSEAPSNPFTAEGIPGTWTAGDLKPADWTFTTYGNLHEMWNKNTLEKKIKGYRKAENPASPWPYVMANVAGTRLAGAYTGNTETHGGDSSYPVRADELLFHPGNTSDVYSGVKCAVAERGVYKVQAKGRSMHASEQYNSVLLGAALPGKGIAGNVLVEKKSNPVGTLECGRLYVEEGGEVFVGTDPNGGNSCDLTAVVAGIVKETGAATNVVSFDVEGAEGTTWSGAGRVGWGTEWESARGAAGAAALRGRWRKELGEKTISVELAVRREGGLEFAAAGGANALMADGAAPGGVSFEVSGLIPGKAYMLYFFARNAEGSAATFTVDGVSAAADGKWFAGEACVAAVEAVADGDGKVAGTYDGGEAFCGLQVEGEDYARYVPKGTVLIVR